MRKGQIPIAFRLTKEEAENADTVLRHYRIFETSRSKGIRTLLKKLFFQLLEDASKEPIDDADFKPPVATRGPTVIDVDENPMERITEEDEYDYRS